MQSIIITAFDKKKRAEYIKQYCRELEIDPLDITLIEKDSGIKQNVNSIGIDEIKNMQRKVFFKPIKSPIKAVVLEDAHLLTVEAQNSMLKILEEPPDNTLIILSTNAKDIFLPTILSRCRIIELPDEKLKLSEEEFNELEVLIRNIHHMPAGLRLAKAEVLSKDKEKASKWIEMIITVLRQKLIVEQSREIAVQIRTLQKYYTLLRTTNVNIRFLMEIMLMKF